MPVHTTSRVIATQNTETYHPPRRDSLAHILLLIRTNRMTQGARHLPGKAPNHCLSEDDRVNSDGLINWRDEGNVENTQSVVGKKRCQRPRATASPVCHSLPRLPA